MNVHLLTALVVLIVIATGCSQPPSSVDVDASVADLFVPDASWPDRGRDTTDLPHPEATPGAHICGALKDTDGQPVQNANVIVCDEVECNMAVTGPAGGFCALVELAGQYRFHSFERIAGGKHYGPVLFPVTVEPAQVATSATIDLGSIYAPLMGKITVLDMASGGDLTLEGGIGLTVAPGAASLPSLADKAGLAAAKVEIKHLHPDLLASRGAPEKPLLAALLVPIDVTFAKPALFSVPARGLAPGTQLSLYMANNTTGKLELKGDAEVTAGSILPTGQGLGGLGWLLFYRE